MNDANATIKLDEVELLRVENLELKRQMLTEQMRRIETERAAWAAQVESHHDISLRHYSIDVRAGVLRRTQACKETVGGASDAAAD
jgi:hypothetical protein